MSAKRTYFFVCCFILFCSLISMIGANRGDGFNIYKALLRGGKSEEDEFVNLVGGNDDDVDRISLFRTPLSSYAETSEMFDKRNFNKFKNMMINKDAYETIPEESDLEKTNRFYLNRFNPRKRGAILSWAIPAANRVRVLNTNYRPPGISRPAP